ncbi:MAG: sodium:calcium antiporter [Candidatus Helarchaeota archaeon]
MIFFIFVGIFFLVIGIIIIVLSSNLAVLHSIKLSSALGVSPLIIGIILVGIGTNIPEILNSIISCGLGHGDIDVGDSIGSILTQITIVFGLIIIAGHRSFKVDKKEIIIMGSCVILALFLVFAVIEKGFFTRIDAIFLILSMPIYMLITKIFTSRDTLEDIKKEISETKYKGKRSKKFHLLIAIVGFIGVGIGSYIIINSIIELSTVLGVHEYKLSFYIASIGTSLPELAVDITAIRKKEYKLLLGDIFGSCIIDATLSISIGQLLFPQAISAFFTSISIGYTLVAVLFVILLLVVRKKVDKKTGILFILIYGISYFLLFFM